MLFWCDRAVLGSRISDSLRTDLIRVTKTVLKQRRRKKGNPSEFRKVKNVAIRGLNLFSHGKVS